MNRHARHIVALAMLVSALAVPGPAAAQDDEALDRAGEALRTGEWMEARRLYRPLVTRVTGERRGEVSGYAETFLATGEYEEGLDAVEDFLDDALGDPDLLYMKGLLLEATGKYEEAWTAYRTAWEEKDDHVRVLLAMGGLLDITGQADEAAYCYNLIAQEYNQNRLRTAYEVGIAAEAMARSGDFHEANDMFRVAYQIDPREVRTLYWWADLFREKFNTADAQRTFEEALDINPNSERLLIGYARSFESLSRWETLANRALDINPRSVDARNLQARIAILDGDLDHARDILVEALEINPLYELSLANMATIHHLRGDTDSFEQVERVALSINPRCGDFYVTLAENCEYSFRYKDAAEFARQAASREYDNWHAYAVAGNNILRLGRIDEARLYLERAYEGDPFDIFARNALELLDDVEQFTFAESEHFSLLIDRTESDVLAGPILDLAEECYDSLSVRYPYRPAGKIQLEAYDDHDDFAVRISGLPGIGLLGVCFGDVVAFDTPRAQEEGTYNWAVTLWHEIAHVMALGISDNRVPRWFTEGLSVYEEKRARPEWGREMQLELFVAYDHDLLLPLGELDRGFTRPTYDEQVLMSYYQSAEVIEYIVNQYGFDAIVELLGAFDGMNWEDACRQVLGVDTGKLNDAFFADLDRRSGAYERVLIDIPPLLSVLREENGGDASEGRDNPFFNALAAGNEQLAGGDLDGAGESFREAIDIFPNFTGSGNAYTGLAEIYRRRGDDDALEDILREYLAISNYGAREARELGDMLDERGDTVAAVHYYLRSMDVAPYDRDAHVRLADLYGKLARYDDEAAQRRMVLALNPPDQARARYHLALSLYNGDRVSEARREVVRSLEMAPAYREAQKLLLACVAADETPDAP